MFAWLRKILQGSAAPGGLPASEEQDSIEYDKFFEEKHSALERVLGPTHNFISFAIVGFEAGGPVNLHYFPGALAGTAIATEQLITPDGTGAKPNRKGAFELIAFSRQALPPTREASDHKEYAGFDRIEKRIRFIFTQLANHAHDVALNPGETCEVPSDDGDNNAFVVLDEFVPIRGEFRFAGRRHGLLLCIEVFSSEIAFAQKYGARSLLKKLMDAGHYPYSDLDRQPVV